MLSKAMVKNGKEVEDERKTVQGGKFSLGGGGGGGLSKKVRVCVFCFCQ